MYKNAARFSQRFKVQTGRDPSKIGKPPSKAKPSATKTQTKKTSSLKMGPAKKKKLRNVLKKAGAKKNKNFLTLHYIICEACGWKISSRNVQRHNRETCPMRKIKPQAILPSKKKAKVLEPGTLKCKYCGFIVLEKRYDYHLQELCSVNTNVQKS
jgi:hypothetical protein